MICHHRVTDDVETQAGEIVLRVCRQCHRILPRLSQIERSRLHLPRLPRLSVQAIRTWYPEVSEVQAFAWFGGV
jgi:hypothetical protein